MKKIIFIVSFSTLCIYSCNYITVKRHLEITKGDTINFNKNSGKFDEKYELSSQTFINALTENINTTDNARIENLEIEKIFLSFSLDRTNSANYLKDITITFLTFKPLIDKIPTLDLLPDGVYDLNKYLQEYAVRDFKLDLQEALEADRAVTYIFNVIGIVPPGQTLRGDVSFNISLSMDVETCEKVPLGFGPSECMVVPITLKFPL